MRQSKDRGIDGAQSTLGTSTDADRALADCVTKPASPPPGRLLTGSVNVRFAPKATEVLLCSELTRGAISRPEQVQQHSVQKPCLLDHLVGDQ
jgi:hypothetical protein